MDSTKTSSSLNEKLKTAIVTPDQKAIKITLASARKAPLKKNAIIIARYQWFIRHKVYCPDKMELPNLCLKIKDGMLKRAFYTNALSYLIKKQNYYIQILN